MPSISFNRFATLLLCGAVAALGLWLPNNPGIVAGSMAAPVAAPSFVNGLYYGILAMLLLFNAVQHWNLSGDRLYLAFLIYLLLTLLHVTTMAIWFDGASDMADLLIALSLAAGGFFWNRMLSLEQRAPRAAKTIKAISVAIGIASVAISFHAIDGLLPAIDFGAFVMAAIASYYAISEQEPSAPTQWETRAAIASIFFGLFVVLQEDLLPIPPSPWTDGIWHFAIVLQMVLLHLAMDRRYREQADGRKQIESDLLAAQHSAELERGLRERHARWISVIAHEFKTPLSIIDTTAASIEALVDNSDEHIPKRCHKIQRSVTRLNSLLTTYLAEERLRSGLTRLNPQLLDVATFMERNLRGILLPPEPKIELKLELDDAPQQIYADRLLLQLMLNNLLNNAVKYSPNGGTITLRANRCERNGQAGMEMTVSDEGIGISRELLPRLFDRYVSGDDRLHQGDHVSVNTGIGLWAVRESVRKHRGDIQVDSQPGIGSRFTIWLPITSVPELP